MKVNYLLIKAYEILNNTIFFWAVDYKKLLRCSENADIANSHIMRDEVLPLVKIINGTRAVTYYKSISK